MCNVLLTPRRLPTHKHAQLTYNYGVESYDIGEVGGRADIHWNLAACKCNT